MSSRLISFARAPLSVSFLLALGCLVGGSEGVQGQVFFGNGIKIGELTSRSAIVWARLTAQAELTAEGLAFARPNLTKGETGNKVDATIAAPEFGYCRQLPANTALSSVRYSMPGAPGQVRLSYRRTEGGDWRHTSWVSVGADSDCAHSFPLTKLEPATRYELLVEGRVRADSPVVAKLLSTVLTAPESSRVDSVSFTVVTGQSFNTRDDSEGQLIYGTMLDLQPSFFVHTGDIVYYDKVDPWVTHIDLARFKWNRSYGQPRVRRFHNEIPSYFIKDDHDSWQNDCWPSMKENRTGHFNWEQGKGVFLEQVPMGDQTYRTIRWGKDLQVWLVEGRDFRTSNDDPDGLEKTIWGREQTAWFERTVRESDATFRVLISPTPILGPDHQWKAGKMDNHVAVGRDYEGTRLRQFLASQGRLYIVCGDRHWQYVSHDSDLGLTEYSCGPTTNRHATELKNDDHRRIRYLNAIGGFLRVLVERPYGKPEIRFQHYDVSGQLQYQELHGS